ncbi:MAG: flagellar basal body FlaE domain protein [Verrucomicrobiaceae bacterium]|nr:flagellar basal body FlaE domain protein [Verrucomicrobiaceae bacterium]
MSFNTALSGLRAANQDLAVTGNNIANASTTGFKESRAEFGDVYANSILGTGARTPGSGVLVNAIAQQFSQGNVNITNNSLDLAINGNGFFILNNQGSPAYTRAGAFGLDNQGYITATNGGKLQGFVANASGQILSGAMADLKIQTQDIAPNSTTSVNWRLNLDSTDTLPATATFNTADASSYNWSTAATVYDSLGNSHTLTSYYTKTNNVVPAPGGTEWQVRTDLDSSGTAHLLGTVRFDTTGGLVGATPPAVAPAVTGVFSSTPVLADTWPGANGANAITFKLNYGSTTQFGTDSTVNSLSQDGYAPGRLSGIDIDDSGVVFARYTNGQALTLGQVALANFANPQGLSPVGNTAWAESFDSGQPVVGAPQSGSRGSIQAGALEDSNVDISSQLVNLILAQRNYQANAKTIETDNAVTQTIINLR